MKITLLRHGKPEFELKGDARASDLKYIIRSYDLSGIVETAPKTVINLSQNHNIVVCSTLPRSIQSAKAIGVTHINLSDAIYNETKLPCFNRGAIKLPVSIWVVILRTLWFLGFSKNTESLSATKARLKEATKKLIQLAIQNESVLLVGHGFGNYFIARELLANGWIGSSHPGKKFWEYGVYHLDKSLHDS